MLSLVGLSVGDAFGQALFFPKAKDWIEQRKLPPAPWKWTDDTQMALSVYEELANRGWIDQDYLANRMAWRFTTDPARGYGRSTRLVLEKIVQGERFRAVSQSAMQGGSFGCSAAARTAPIGGFYCEWISTSRNSYYKATHEACLAAAITHIHPEGLAGAQAVAAAAAIAANSTHPEGVDFLGEILKIMPDSQVKQGIELAINIPSNDLDQAVRLFGHSQFNTVQTAVPFSLWCAAFHLNNFEEAMWWTVSGLGNRDATCAIVGGIVALSAKTIPAEWIKRREALPREIGLASLEVELIGLQSSRDRSGINPQIAPEHSKDRTAFSIRTEPLTRLPNLLGFIDWADQLANQREIPAFSLVGIRLVSLSEVTRKEGQTGSDNLLRLYAQSLRDQMAGPVFQLSQDTFVICLKNDADAIYQACALRNAATEPGDSAPYTTVIRFPGHTKLANGEILASVYMALSDSYYQNNDGTPRLFGAADLQKTGSFPKMIMDLAGQMKRVSQRFDEAERLAQTDSVSQLPNMRAAMNVLEDAVQKTHAHNEPLAIILIDGDNLRQYNTISYEAGDEAIRLLGTTLKDSLRKNDFVARWRTGDEFLVLLPNTGRVEAIRVAQHLCDAVQAESQKWLFPSTISAGIAIYPDHGPTIQDLLHMAEQGMDTAKEEGKNRVQIMDR